MEKVADGAAARRRRSHVRRIGVGTAVLLAIALGSAWFARKPIADRIISGTLRSKGVEGRYVIARIGPRTQRLEALVLGDPAHPDLTARWVEIDFAYGLSGPRVARLRASGVRLRGAYRNGTLDLGALNRLMGEGQGTTALPDIVVQLDDARLSLATDYGPLGLALEGRGNLRSGFLGDLGLASPRLALGGCRIDRLRAPLAVATEGGDVSLKGPIAAQGIACPAMALSLASPRLDADLRADPALKAISAAVSLSAPEAHQGERRLTALSGLVTTRGSADELRGSAALAAVKAALGPARTGALKLGGNFALRPRAKDEAYSYAGTLTAEDIRPTGDPGLDRLKASAAGTPLAPLADKLADAVKAAGAGNRLSLTGRISGEGSKAQLLVNGVDFAARSGARLALANGARFTLDLPARHWALDGALAMSGGGLPDARLLLRSGPGGALAGRLGLQPYAAGPARLGLTPVDFARAGDGAWRVRTVVSLDGPLPDGAVKGLTVPVDARIAPDGAVRLAGDCTPLRWSALRLGPAAFDPAALSLCGVGRDALRLAAVRLTGTLGESPLALSADSARYAPGAGGFALGGVHLGIGTGESAILLNAATLDGTSVRGILAGRFTGAAGTIGTVPLNLSDMAGQWRFAGGRLAVDGALRVSDRIAGADPRFNPLLVPDAKLALVDGHIDAAGTLVAAGTPAHRISQPIARVLIGHDLGTGAGQAAFALTGLSFGAAVQPDDLTSLALGVIANVEGPVEGKGAIRWTRDGITSEGDFSARNMAFAAAFGPVTGFSTDLHFTDLLGLRTAPHQRLTVKQVSAGVDVFDGVVDYALLSSGAAQIEGGRWPFAGGRLELLPATLNLDARQPRRLTFRVVGLDAGAFINTLDLENISATGTFDGLFPMVFDADGGRIEGGLLVARQQGFPPLILSSGKDPLPACDPLRQSGDLAYVGPVSNAQLGVMGKLAFDALKNLRYRCLAVQLDGALDGEFVTQLAINGVNQGTEEARKSFISRPFLGLPFIFNVRITAPFRGLLATATSFADPSALIRGQLEAERNSIKASTLAVQPADSDKSIEGNRK